MRIITYNDPRCIDKIENWEEIKNIPHLCISQTLVQGISHKVKRSEMKFLSTVDKVLKGFYSEWLNDKEKNVNQFLDINRAIDEIVKEEKYKKPMKSNAADIIKAIKFLLEADIKPKDLSTDRITREQVYFIQIYKEIYNKNNWVDIQYIDSKGKEDLCKTFELIIYNEIYSELSITGIKEEFNLNEFIDLSVENKRKLITKKILDLTNELKTIRKQAEVLRQRNIIERLNMYLGILEFKVEELNKIVIHGIHQFTPIIYRFIKKIEALGIEVIFMFNYNNQFKNIYSTWEKIYEFWKSDWSKNEIDLDEYSRHSDIATAYGDILEGNLDVSKKDIEIMKFNNYTEMCNYIGDIYQRAKEEANKSTSKGKSDESSIRLARMAEQFYSPDGEIANEILSVYFPEQFERKQFLAYPIGQFIVAMHSMWNEEKNVIEIESSNIKECLMLDIWKKQNAENFKSELTPCEIYEKIELYLSNIEPKEDEKIEKLYLDRLGDLRKSINKLNKDGYEKEKEYYQKISFFSIKINDLNYFEMILKDLFNIASVLFKDNNHNISKYYNNLLSLVKERAGESLLKEEKEIIDELSIRFENMDNEEVVSSEELKKTLGFYLKESRKDEGANWIVKGFDQLDGGVLLADRTGKEHRGGANKAIYHFMELSDSKMKKSRKNSLVWPLDENFLGYKNKKTDLIKLLNIVNSEYKNYLRYTLFYGLNYISDREVKLSYVESIENDKKEDIYYILNLINAKIKENKIEKTYSIVSSDEVKLGKSFEVNKLSELDLMRYKFCPTRFCYESLIDKDGVYVDEFQIKMYIQTLFMIFIFDISKTNKSNEVKAQNIEKRLNHIKSIFPYLSVNDFNDIKKSTYEKFEVIRNNDILSKDYKQGRLEFIHFKFNDEIMKIKYQEKNTIKESIDKFVKERNYKNIIDDFEERINRCTYCKYKNICSK